MTATELNVDGALLNTVEDPRMSPSCLWWERRLKGEAAQDQIWALPLWSSFTAGKALSPL